jgi:hypothetical protein
MKTLMRTNLLHMRGTVAYNRRRQSLEKRAERGGGEGNEREGERIQRGNGEG